jgi:hypothetical protein
MKRVRLSLELAAALLGAAIVGACASSSAPDPAADGPAGDTPAPAPMDGFIPSCSPNGQTRTASCGEQPCPDGSYCNGVAASASSATTCSPDPTVKYWRCGDLSVQTCYVTQTCKPDYPTGPLYWHTTGTPTWSACGTKSASGIPCSAGISDQGTADAQCRSQNSCPPAIRDAGMDATQGMDAH